MYVRLGMLLGMLATALTVGCGGGGYVSYQTAVLSKVQESGAVLELYRADDSNAQGEIKLPEIGSLFIDSARLKDQTVTFKVSHLKPTGGEKEEKQVRVRKGETGEVWFNNEAVGLRFTVPAD